MKTINVINVIPVIFSTALYAACPPNMPTTIPSAETTPIGTVVQICSYGCDIRSEGGGTRRANGVYTAPTGYSIVSYNFRIGSQNRRGFINAYEQTQPGFMYLREANSEFTQNILHFIENQQNEVYKNKLLSVITMLETERVVSATSHAVLKFQCSAVSRVIRILGIPVDRQNGWISTDVIVTLKREPIEKDFMPSIIEIINGISTGKNTTSKSIDNLLPEHS